MLVLAGEPAQTQPIPASDPDRYEPLPGLAQLPLWAWRKLGRRAKVAVVLAVVLFVGSIVVLASGQRASERERVADERRDSAARRADRVRRLRAEQRPQPARSRSVDRGTGSARGRFAARTALVEDVERTVLSDARRRVRAGTLSGRVSRVDCEPFPRTVGGVAPERDLDRRRGRYACVAVTGEFENGADGGVIGHPYRVLADFATGRFTFCKTTGVAGPERDQAVTVPPACGGRPAAERPSR